MKNALIILTALIFGSYNCVAGIFDATFTTKNETGDPNSAINFSGNIKNTIWCCPITIKMTILSSNISSDWNITLETPSGEESEGVTSTTIPLIPDGSADIAVNFYLGNKADMGDATIRFEDANNSADFMDIQLTVNGGASTGIEVLNHSTDLIQIYPNPISGPALVSYELNSSKGILQISDVLGKNIKDYDLHGKSGTVSINVKLNAGVYFYSLWENDQIIETKKVVVVH